MDVSVLWIGKTEYPELLGIKSHSHEYVQLFYVTSGQGVFHVDHQEYAFIEGDCILVNAGRIHRLNKIHECTLRMLDIKFMVENKDLLEKMKRVPVKLSGLSAIRKILEEIKSEGEQKTIYYKQITQSLLLQLLYLLLRSQGGQHTNVEAVKDQTVDRITTITKAVQCYIQRNYYNELTLDTISEALAYNKIYLCASFKRDTGITINEFVYRTRILQACEMIRYGDLSLKQISLSVGFKSIHHFSRKFKEVVGISPGSFRRSQGGIQIVLEEGFQNVDNYDGWQLNQVEQ